MKFPFTATSRFHPPQQMLDLVADEPVARVELPDGGAAWLVTGFDEVRQVLTDPRFSRALAVDPARQQRRSGGVIAAESLLGMDPPKHTRLRKLVTGAFTARRVDRLRPEVVRIVNELIDGLVAGPRPADLVAGFALPLPVRVICAMLGVPEADQERFHGWSTALLGDWESDQAAMAAAFAALCGYMAELIAAKRAAPADDLMSALIAARDESDRLDEDELVRLGVTLLFAGHSTTANQITMSLVTLLADQEQLARLRAAPDLVPTAIEELMRFVQLIGPGGAIPLGRVTAEEVRIGEVTIPAGETVLPALPAANRDPAIFGDPDRLDLTRSPNPHLSFGHGIHHCLGAQLARMNLQEAFQGLLTRLPHLRLAVPADELPYTRSMVINSLRALPVTWDER